MLATKGTFKGELYLRTLHKFASNATVIEQVGEGLVELVENGHTDTPQARELIGKYVVPMLEKNVDHIVLGCTHYPFLEGVIKEFTGEAVEIVNPAPAIARRAGEVLAQKREKSGQSAEQGVNTFVTTGGNMEVMEQMVEAIAPEKKETFVFKNIDL